MPLVEIVSSGTLTKIKKSGAGRKRAVAANHPANAKRADSAVVKRAIARRIADLERENYNDLVKIDIPRVSGYQNSNGVGPSVSGRTAGVRKLLQSKKALQNLFDEDESGASEFMSVISGPSIYPSRNICSVCGYWGPITCSRCNARYCSLACEDTHRETRCLKVYA
ncbi:SWR1 complex subunit vps71 [Kockiozyma suomiensis]|uniref:SWR1 complex subunit vps71 n=1 Tax=Kockiozyma suomiensis TaxID=1337062 RepID=UPI0033440B4C